MRFSIAAVIAAVVITANAAAIAERKEAVANPLACVSLGLSGLGTLDLLTCSAPTTCSVAITESLPLLLLGTLTVTAGVGYLTRQC